MQCSFLMLVLLCVAASASVSAFIPFRLGRLLLWGRRPARQLDVTTSSTDLTTSTSVETVTLTDTVRLMCAKLVNVTGACVRRRGVWLEEPIVLTFNDDMDDVVDVLYTPVVG